MQLIATILALCLAAGPALAEQSLHRRDMNESQMVLKKTYDKYNALLALQQMGGADPDCPLPGKKKCDERLGDSLRMIGAVQTVARRKAGRDFTDMPITVVTPGMSLAQAVEALHVNQGEVQAILDRYARDGQ